MIDFGALPPEINSGRMYTGSGAASLLAAAAAWDELATELQSTAASYGSTIESLTVGTWTGPSSIAMASAVTPYVAWIGSTGAQAEEPATQAKLAASAYETAFAATVPPPVIAANRALLMSLIATNILGQNTPAIMATEAQYIEMWAQDSAAMYAYAASSAAASQLTTFTEPPQTTNSTAAANQAAAVSQAGGQGSSNIASSLSSLINGMPSVLQNLANATFSSTAPTASTGNVLSGIGSSASSIFNLPPVTSTSIGSMLTNWNTIWSGLSGPYSPLFSWTSIPGGPFLSFGQVYAYAQNGQALAAFGAPKAISGALAPLASETGAQLSSASVGGAVSGSMGKSALVSGLSVPQGWTQAAPAVRTLANTLALNQVLPAADLSAEESVFSQMGLSSLAGRALGAAYAPASGGSAGSIGSIGGVLTEADPAAATIIVIPALED